jgi:hypothetical protein
MSYWTGNGKHQDLAYSLDVSTDPEVQSTWAAANIIYNDFHSNGWGSEWFKEASIVISECDLDPDHAEILLNHCSGIEAACDESVVEGVMDAIVVALTQGHTAKSNTAIDTNRVTLEVDSADCYDPE